MRFDAIPVLTYEQRNLARTVIEEHVPTKSGVYVELTDTGRLKFLPPLNPIHMSDQTLARTFPQQLNEHRLDQLVATSEPTGSSVDALKYGLIKDFQGGSGITERPIEQLDIELPGIESVLNTTTGKVGFLGNGFSPAPLTVAKRYEQGKVTDAPVIVDTFDYPVVVYDLQGYAEDFRRHDLPLFTWQGHSVETILNGVTSLNEAIKQESLVAVNYFLGLKHPPQEMRDLTVAINCWGPKSSTINEQLSLLTRGGSLYSTYSISRNVPFNYWVSYIRATECSVVKRLI